jgi:mannose-6-phosphate isomerase-like protein (cupin superfamily)
MTATITAPYALERGSGTTDLWWPYGPSAGRYTFKTGGEQTDGRFAQLLIEESRGAATPLHVHRDTDETFFVLDGTLTIVVGDERFDAGPGSYVFAPMGVAHAFVVTSERAEFLVTVCSAGTAGPAGHGIEGFFREVAPAVVAGETPPAPAVPDPGEFAGRMDVYGIDLVGPPPAA